MVGVEAGMTLLGEPFTRLEEAAAINHSIVARRRDAEEEEEEEMKKGGGGGGDPGGSTTSGTIILIIKNNNSNNKRKIHDIELSEEEDGLPVPKHACLDNSKNHPLSQIQDSVMSLSNDSKHAPDVSSSSSSSSSVNWGGADSICYHSSNHHFDYPSPSFDQQPQLDYGDMMTSIPEYYYETNHQSLNLGDEDSDSMFFSNNAAAAAEEEASSPNYVLSSGGWNIVNKQDTEQITEKLTIDKEFEQYFSMLML